VKPLRLYNTWSRRKELFEPLEPERVRIYSCGPTVYSRQHIGNMRPYLFADLLTRTLRYAGYSVYHVINITDVGHLTGDSDEGEDRMEVAARTSGEDIWAIAEKYTAQFKADLERLRVRPPDVWCKATDHVPEQIAMIRTLEDKGFTYRTSDGIYFDVSKDPHYGYLARIDLEAQQSQERIAGAHEKRNRADFALWKFSPTEGPPRQMEWESPWGTGFPGWHIECSAMSSRYLGVPFDIHTGGIDHLPVHHPNEVAQSENAFDVRPWVRFWLHEEWLLIDGGKISKSKGHTIALDDLADSGIQAAAFRLFFLGAHYRQKQSFTEEAIRGAKSAYERLLRHALELQREGEGAAPASGAGQESPAAADLRARFDAAILDDLNAPQALAVLWETVRSAGLEAAERRALIWQFDEVLGLGLAEAREEPVELDADIEALVAERQAARAARDFARADRIRDDLLRRGILLEDTTDGVRWRRA
jgi:cysteinyl-tRNA synthetase